MTKIVFKKVIIESKKQRLFYKFKNTEHLIEKRIYIIK